MNRLLVASYREKTHKMKSYRDLEIFNSAFELAITVHKMSLTLPQYEMYEQGSQVRRSSKSVKDNIAEGFGRRRYKAEFIRFMIFSHASCDECISQLNMIACTHPQIKGLDILVEEYTSLSKKINKFIQYIETEWK